MALVNRRTELCQAIGHRTAAEIGAGDFETEAQQNLGDAAHADAADSDEVRVLRGGEHEAEKITLPSASLHLSVDVQSAINTVRRQSCGALFSRWHRNTQSNALFNWDITGVLRVSRIQTRGEIEGRAGR